MTLWEAYKGQECRINTILVEELLRRRLEALGMNEGTPVLVVSKKRSGAMIIKVRGTRLALGKHITTLIEVYDAKKGIKEQSEPAETKDTMTERMETGNESK